MKTISKETEKKNTNFISEIETKKTNKNKNIKR